MIYQNTDVLHVKKVNPRSYIKTAQQQNFTNEYRQYLSNNGFTNNKIRNLYCKRVYYSKYSSLVEYQH